MREFPDVLGMELSVASALLESEGLAFRVVETKPTKREPLDGILRVIRIKLLEEFEIDNGDALELTVCKI